MGAFFYLCGSTPSHSTTRFTDFHLFLFFELTHVQVVVKALFGHQLVMPAFVRSTDRVQAQGSGLR